MTTVRWRWFGTTLAVAALVTAAYREAPAQVPLGWDATQYFKYNIENVTVDKTVAPWTVKVVFSVTNPSVSGEPPWDIKTDVPFRCTPTTTPACPAGGPSPSLTIDIGWNTIRSVNTGSRIDPATGTFSLDPVFVNATNNRGLGAAFPIRINALTVAAQPCTVAACGAVPAGRFWVSSPLPPAAIGAVQTGAVGSGQVGMEGHPVWPLAAPTENVPVKSVFKPFAITDPVAVPRRQIVDFDTKCSKCHDGQLHDGHLIPRLALHGGNRNEEPGLCVICHNPNQTDIPYRSLASPPSTDPLIIPGFSGVAPEVSIDFKRMPHAIHAGGFRTRAYSVVAFGGTVADFGAVRFPATLSNCLNCHIEVGGKGTFELPLAPGTLGATVKTGSIIGYVRPSDGQVGNLVNLDPTDNLRITPIASVCSACHDKPEKRTHMIQQGARFGVLQADIDAGRVREKCVNCHGPGKDKDVRKVHEIGSGEVDD